MDKSPLVCYWNKTGYHQHKMMLLHNLIPGAGPVPKCADNPNLDVLRKAINIYSDLYNTALLHKAQAFAATFKFRSTDYLITSVPNREFSPRLYTLVEEAMNDIVMNAWLEQLSKGTVS